MLRIRDILVQIRIRTYGQRIRYLTQDLAPDPGIFFSDQDDNKKKFSKIFCSLLFEATKFVHLCSWHCAHRVYAAKGRAHSSTLSIFAVHLPVCRIRVEGWMPRTKHCAHRVYAEQGRAHSSTLPIFCRALACVQNPCGGVDAKHHPQRVCSRHCAHRVYAEQGRAHIYSTHLSRALTCVQNPCGGVDAAHQPQRVCSRHCAHLLYPSLPRTCLCAESVWWGGCRAPTAACVLQALRAPRVRRTWSSTLLSSRYHLKYFKTILRCISSNFFFYIPSIADPDPGYSAVLTLGSVIRDV